MKLYQIVFIILGVSSLGCKAKKNEVIIKGKIIGDIHAKVEYTTPIKGTWFYGSKKPIQPDSLGNFSVIMNIESPSFVTLYIPEKASGTLLVESGKTYNVNFDLKSKEAEFIVKGENSKGQSIYNSFPNPDFTIFGLKEFLKDSVSSVISSKIEIAKAKEVLLFTELFNKGEISNDFFTLVKLDRDCYYAAVQGKVASNKFREAYQSNNEELKASSLSLWSETFNRTPITTSKLIRSPWFYSLTESYVNYNEYKNPSFNIEKLTKIYKQSLIHTHQMNEAKKHLIENRLESYTALYLYYQCWQNKDNSKELITLYNDFKKDYSNSEYLKYLRPIISPMIKFHNKVAEDVLINEKFKFIDNYENIDSFDKLTKSLKGNKVYIDIWTTWCGPCKQEFSHKAALMKLLKSKNIEILYISHDKDEKNELWKEMIKGHGLEGYHIRANKALQKDIIKIFGNNGSFFYPRYILIDENGKIIHETAKRPSQLKELGKELNTISQD